MVPKLRAFVPGRYEMWISFPILIVAGYYFWGHRPEGPSDTVGRAISVLFAWVLTLNSVIAVRQMTLAERVAVGLWFPVVSYLAFIVLRDAFTTTMWADR